jgi:uncharacterized protein YjbJ (UPF0337 family)
MSFIDAVTDPFSNVTNLLENVSDLAQNPLVTTALNASNPISMGIASFTVASGLTSSLVEQAKEQMEFAKPANQRRGRGEQGKCGGRGESADAGGSVFERIALAMGEAMDKKLQQLLQAADEVASLSDQLAGKADPSGKLSDKDKTQGEGGIMKASAQVTARGQELNSISQAFNSAINSLGQAAGNAARKT